MYKLFHLTAQATEADDDTSCGPRWGGYICVFAFQCLLMVLPTLKLLHLFGVNKWSWGWVTIPLWGPGLLLALLLVVERVVGSRKVGGPVLVDHHYRAIAEEQVLAEHQQISSYFQASDNREALQDSYCPQEGTSEYATSLVKQ